MGNVFERTAVFSKDNGNIRRIPWDLIGFGDNGFFASPVPMPGNFDGRVQTAVYTPDICDMLIENDDSIDNIIDIIYFESEAVFNARFEGAFGFYTTDFNQSGEFGYPRS